MDEAQEVLQLIDQPVDAAEVEKQYAADQRVDKLELPRVLAVEMIVRAGYRAERKDGQRAAGGLVDTELLRWDPLTKKNAQLKSAL